MFDGRFLNLLGWLCIVLGRMGWMHWGWVMTTIMYVSLVPVANGDKGDKSSRRFAFLTSYSPLPISSHIAFLAASIGSSLAAKTFHRRKKKQMKEAIT